MDIRSAFTRSTVARRPFEINAQVYRMAELGYGAGLLSQETTTGMADAEMRAGETAQSRQCGASGVLRGSGSSSLPTPSLPWPRRRILCRVPIAGSFDRCVQGRKIGLFGDVLNDLGVDAVSLGQLACPQNQSSTVLS